MTKRIIRKDTGAVVYMFPDSQEVIVSGAGIEVVGDFIIGDLNSGNAIVTHSDAEYVNHLKSEKSRQIVDDFESAVAQITAGYTLAERDSFGKQEQQALAFNANPDETRTDLKMLKNMATQRNKTMQQVADRILLKADAFERAFGDLLGIKQSREDALAALGDGATLSQVEAI